jgi:hypothetical protein
MSQSRGSDPFGGREPPPALRDRITSSLHAGGLLEPQHVRIQRTVMRGAALVAVVAIAFVAGRFQSSTARPAGPEFLILLYEDSSYRDDRPVREIVAEYGGWADSLRRTESLVVGEKLSTDRVQVATTVGSGGVMQHPTGLFIVRAASLEAATGIARSSPHLKYGGTVLVHRIDH